MGEFTHKAERAAFSVAIDKILKHINKDREQGLLDLVDLTERFMGDQFPASAYEGGETSDSGSE
jgi:hypothetical protein